MTSTRPDLLFLAHRIPYPPNKGDKIRSWNILRHLAERHRVHLGCFVDDAYDRRYEPVLREICGDCHFAALGGVTKRLRAVRGLAAGDPLTLSCYRDGAMAAWVRDVVARRRPAAVFVSSSAMAQYVMGPEWDGGVRRVLDFMDVDSDKWRQYAEGGTWPRNWIHGRESRLLLDFERRAAAAFDASLFVSPHEVALFGELAPESAARTSALRNGVDTGYFDPGGSYDDPYGGDRDVVVFTGAMDYWANAHAVDWFAREVLPGVQARRPGAQFHVVGSNPTAEVRRLGALPGVTVTGRVADVRPYLAHAGAVVAPLRIARGVQNKVLEAMAMAKGVVATPQALEGIDAAVGTEVLMAAEPDDFAARTASLLAGEANPDLGASARARVLADYGWPASLVRLDGLLGSAG